MLFLKTLLLSAPFLACALAQGPPGPTTTPVPILKQINKQNDDGSYSYGYEAADGSFKIETKYPNGDVAGKYGYLDESGKLREISYGASSQRGFEPQGAGIMVPPPTLHDPSNTNALTDGQEDDGQYREDPRIYEDPKYNTKNPGRPLKQYQQSAQPVQYEPQYQRETQYQRQTQVIPQHPPQRAQYQPQPQPQYQTQPQPQFQPQPQPQFQPQPQPQYQPQSTYKSPLQSFFNQPQQFPTQTQVYHQQPQFSYQTSFAPQPYNQYQSQNYQNQNYVGQNFNPFFGHPAQNFDPNTGSYSINFTG